MVRIALSTLLGLLMTSAALASLPPFSLAVGASHFCALTGPAAAGSAEEGSTVACWDRSGAPIEVPRLNHPRAIAVGERLGGVYGRYSCAVAEGSVRCWGEAGERLTALFRDLKSPMLIAAGSSDLCVADAEQGIVCYGGEVPWTLIASNVPRVSRVTALALGAFHACALDGEGHPVCWGGVHPDYRALLGAATAKRLEAFHPALLSPPKELRGATEISVGVGHACALSPGGLKCWGGNFEGEAEPPRFATTSLRSVNASVYRTCVLDGGRAACWGRAGELSAWLSTAKEYPIALRSNSEEYPAFQSVCLADDSEIRCVGRITVTVRHQAFGYNLTNFETELDRIAHYMYRPKAEFLREAARLARSFGAEEKLPRLFLLNALKPLLENARVAYLEREVNPRFFAALDYYDNLFQVRALRDFGRTEKMLRLSIGLIHSALRSGEKLLVSSAYQRDISEANATLGALLARPELRNADAAAVTKELEKLAAFRNTLLGSERTQGLGVVLQSLLDYLGLFQ